MTVPTPTPRYQPFFCEENVWQLCEREGFGEKDAYAVFISNAHRTCALWSQRAAPAPGAPIVWDYHVVLVDDSEPTAQLWDLDSLVGAPVPFAHWWQATFPLEDVLPEQFQPCFRVIAADEFLDAFSSDRSHMRDDGGGWRQPPPSWAPIFCEEQGMNLEGFIDMDADSPGEVMERAAFRCRFAPEL